jgi:hypothetical protein
MRYSAGSVGSLPRICTVTGPRAAAVVALLWGIELSSPRGAMGTITMKMIRSTRRTSISGVTLISEDCEEVEPAENAMEHLDEVSERLRG